MPRKPNPSRPRYASMIAEARNAKGWTQTELGERVGKDGASIKKYEGGKVVPPFDTLFRICKVLELDPYDVMDLDLKHSNSDTFRYFIDIPFEEILSMLDDEIEIVPLSGSGYTNNDISVIYKDVEGYTTKTDLVLQVADIKEKLLMEYREKLIKEVNLLAKAVTQKK